MKSDERKPSNTSAITRPNITYKNDASTRPLPSSTEPPTLRARSDQNARNHGPIGFRHPTGFTLDGTQHFILEAKWEKELTGRDDLDVFLGKVNRTADNTLGLFFAIAGFQPTAIELHSKRRSPLVLSDGGDLLAILDERIDLDELLRRKYRHASMTGEVYLPVTRILIDS